MANLFGLYKFPSYERIRNFIDELLTYTSLDNRKDVSYYITICYRCFWITKGEPDRYKVFCEICKKDDKTIVRWVHKK